MKNKILITSIFLTLFLMLIAYIERGYFAIGGECFIWILLIMYGVEHEPKRN